MRGYLALTDEGSHDRKVFVIHSAHSSKWRIQSAVWIAGRPNHKTIMLAKPFHQGSNCRIRQYHQSGPTMSSTMDLPLHQPQTGVASTVVGDFPLDESVVSQLPEGTKVLSAHQHGYSDWTVTARIVTQLPDGTLKKYFLKCVTGDAGHIMMEGEYWAMTELFKIINCAIARPIARGRFQREHPPTYFLLCEFIDMSKQMPDPDRLCALIVDLHRNSVSPTGKFGFHVRTCQGRTPQATANWESSWTKFFSNLMEHILSEDLRINGPWP